jgi:flagellar hook protein FlgE
MIRSLYAAISGLRAQQVGMDVTANNIANVNTVGFKAGRATFKEAMAQLLKGPSRPPGAAGGTNPMQIGLGTSVGSIDTILTQGNMQSTGQITDLALEGTSYFAYSSGQGTFYSRNGAMQFDSTGRLVCPTNGFTLQGMTAAADGTYPVGSKIGDIRIPFGEKAPAKPTSEVTYGCNLDSDSEGLGTVANTNRFLAAAIPAQTLTSLYDSSGNALGIMAGDTLTVRGYNAAGAEFTQSLIVTPTSTLTDLRNAIAAVTNNVDPAIPVTINADGSINVTTAGAAGGPVNNLSVSSSRPGSNSYVSNAFTWGPTIATASATGANSNQIRRPAVATDLLASLYDSAGMAIGGVDPVTGNPRGLEDGDLISVNGAVGGKTITTGTLTYTAATTRLQDLLNTIQSAFNLPINDGTPQNNLSVSMDAPDTADDRMPDGSIVMRGQKELAFALQNMSISANNSNNNAVSPARFNANLSTTELQAARNTGQQSTSIVVYDESGDAHTLTTTFTHSGTPGTWLWQITTNAGETVLGGNTGRITFGQDGSPSSFTFDDGSTRFRFDPMNGSNEIDVNLNVGHPGSFTGITQFRSPSTTAARSQDGYPMGKLQEVSIDEYGEIKGLYTNGVSKSIAKIYVADFNNPAGLLKTNDSMFAVSNNSGEAVMQQPGVGTPTKIKPGALEMSNVELATEFTNMITTQRAYQSSARVITMSDSLLQELVQLVR